MKLEVNIGKPAVKAHIGPHSQFAATIKVDGRPFTHTYPDPDGKPKTAPVEFVGEDEQAAITSMCKELLRKDTIAGLFEISATIKAEKKAEAEAKADKK